MSLKKKADKKIETDSDAFNSLMELLHFLDNEIGNEQKMIANEEWHGLEEVAVNIENALSSLFDVLPESLMRRIGQVPPDQHTLIVIVYYDPAIHNFRPTVQDLAILLARRRARIVHAVIRVNVDRRQKRHQRRRGVKLALRRHGDIAVGQETDR